MSVGLWCTVIVPPFSQLGADEVYLFWSLSIIPFDTGDATPRPRAASMDRDSSFKPTSVVPSQNVDTRIVCCGWLRCDWKECEYLLAVRCSKQPAVGEHEVRAAGQERLQCQMGWWHEVKGDCKAHSGLLHTAA